MVKCKRQKTKDWAIHSFRVNSTSGKNAEALGAARKMLPQLLPRLHQLQFGALSNKGRGTEGAKHVQISQVPPNGSR